MYTERTHSFELDVAVDDLFPLFSPEGETLWVPGWEYRNVMGTTQLSEDYVFLTGSQDHAAVETVWLVKTYQPDKYFVQFYRVQPGDKAGVVTVQCKMISDAKTEARVTYKYIALSESGEQFLAGFTEEFYRDFIGEWKVLLTDYFEKKAL
jgi:hypothetical protein